MSVYIYVCVCERVHCITGVLAYMTFVLPVDCNILVDIRIIKLAYTMYTLEFYIRLHNS